MNHVTFAQGPGMGPPGDVFLILGWLLIAAHVLVIGACWIITRRVLRKPKEPNLPRALLLWLGGVVGAAIAPLPLFALAPSFISHSLGILPLGALGEGDAGPLLLYVVIPVSVFPAVLLEFWRPRWGALWLVGCAIVSTHLILQVSLLPWGIWWPRTTRLLLAFNVPLLFLGVGLYLTVKRKRFQFTIRRLLLVFVLIAVALALIVSPLREASRRRWVADTIRAADITLSADGQGFAADPSMIQYATVACISDSRRAEAVDLAVLAKLPELRELRLTNTSDQILSRLPPLPALATLTVEESHDVIGVGLTCLEGFSQLEHLTLRDTQTTDAGLAHLHGLHQLRVLDLSGTRVTGSGFVHLKGLSRLESIACRGAPVSDITDEGLDALAQLVHLKLFDLRNSSLSSGDIDKLKRRLPWARVLASRSWSPKLSVDVPARDPGFAKAIHEMQRLGGRFLVNGYKPSWSPDGTRIAFSHAEFAAGVGILDLRTGAVMTLTAPGKDPAWSPGDGKFIAYVGISESRDEEVWLVEASGGQPRRLAEGGFPSWSADGKKLFYQSRKEGRLKVMQKVGEKPVVADAVPLSFPYSVVSPDGKLLASRNESDLLIIDLESGDTVKLWTLPRSEGLAASFSPNGEVLGFGGWGADDTLDLWMMDLETSHATRLLPQMFTLPVWSPDGSQLTVDLRTSRNRQIYLLNATVVEQARAYQAHVAPWAQKQASPNGQEAPSTELADLQVTEPYLILGGYIRALVKNGGARPTARFDVAFLVDGTRASVRRRMYLDPGAEEEVGTIKLLPGTHVVKVVADPDNRVAESDETNNFREATLTSPR